MLGGRTRAPRWALLICVAAALAAIAVGCGSNGDGSGTTAKPKTTAADAAREAKLMAIGSKVFFEKCHSCHTMLGRKHTKPYFELRVPNFDQVKLTRPAYVRQRVLTGGFDMQSFQGELSPKQIEGVVTYVTKTAGRDVDAAAADTHTTDIASGEQVFQQHCASCHGIGGKPRTRANGLGTDFNGVKPNEAYVIEQMMLGVEGVMPSFKRRLTSAEMRAVATYVTSVGGENPSAGRE